jgi:hypothetical protein
MSSSSTRTLVGSLLVALFASHGVKVFAQAIPSAYTQEELRDRAQAYLLVRERSQRISADIALSAGEFRGYVAGQLDGLAQGAQPDKKLADCARQRSLDEVAVRAARGVKLTPLDRRVSASATLTIAVYIACEMLDRGQ